MDRWYCAGFGWLLWVVLCLGSLAPAFAQDGPKPPAERDLARFAQLPARFNGRVTTYDVIARNYLRRFSGGEVCYDKSGKEQPAVRWLLEVMAQTDDRNAWRVFKIENAKLLEFLELKPHPEPGRNMFSVSEIDKKFDALDEKYGSLLDKPARERTLDERAVVELFDHLRSSLVLSASLEAIAVKGQNAEAIIGRIELVNQHAVPLFVFDEDGKKWSTAILANLAEAVRDKNQKAQSEHHRRFSEILKSHRDGDREAFGKKAGEYAELLKTSSASNSPFQWDPRAPWLEMGVPPRHGKELFFYDDAGAPGHKIAELYLAGTHYSEFVINHFPEGDISPVDLQNSWRISLGLAPLSEAEARKSWESIQIGGRKAILMDDSTPAGIELPGARRYISVVLQEEGHTFVLAWFGEQDVLDRHRRSFDRLMNSIRMKSIKEVGPWFHVEADSELPPAPDRLLAAVIPDGGMVWAFVTSGPANLLENQREAFQEFLKTVNLEPREGRPSRLDWELPKDWTKVGGYGEVTLVLGQDENALPMTVTPLGEAGADTVPLLVEYWTKKLRLGELPAKDRENFQKEISVSNRKAYWIDIQKPGERVKDSAISYVVPISWKKGTPNPIAHNVFEIVQGDAAVKIMIVSLPAKGNLAENIIRWRAQLDLPEVTAEKALESAKPFDLGNKAGKLVELHNPKTARRTLVAVAAHGGKDWYFKMMGDEKMVETEQKLFEVFLKGVRFLGKDSENAEGQNP